MPTPEAIKGAYETITRQLEPFLHDALTGSAKNELRDIIAEALDRFAAQRGAEAKPLDVKLHAAQQARSVLHPFRQSHHLLTNTEWEDLQTAIAKAIASGAPPQTGGGDAQTLSPDVAREISRRGEIISSAIKIAREVQTGGGDVGERARAIMRRLRDMGGVFADPVNHRQDSLDDLTRAIEDAETDVTAALRASHREAVFAFTEAILHGDDAHRKWLRDAATAFVDGRALPIPGKTDDAREIALWFGRFFAGIATANFVALIRKWVASGSKTDAG